ncbi:MAG: SDR family NAD(P)-dependent oxidoreductase [Bacteroidales bacterium]|nr:SDR family NAD(P)-dependent oxidoreductase [Bacteroidales bacterium]
MKNADNKKVVLITGASSGIGEVAALRLLKRGCTVYAAARRMERMKGLEEAGAQLLQMDVTDEASMQAAVARIGQEQGRLDVLVNNAGYGSYGAVETVPMDEARRQMEVNVFGLARLSQLVLPMMRKQGGGRIVNVASIAGHFNEPRGGWYHATKHAVVALSDSMRMELKAFGIDVVLIEPGMIASEWAEIAMQHLEKISAGTPYEAAAKRQAAFFRYGYAHHATPADRVGRSIEQATLNRRPRVRYRDGRGSTMIPLLHALLPTRWMDWAVRRMLG